MRDSLSSERDFHDEWASSVDPSSVDVMGAWTELATPETHWISEILGNIEGLKVLDLGCGLGEGSVFFALQGGSVTASDLSPEMCKMAQKVASIHGVEIETLVTSATDLRSIADGTFDLVYGANMLHHVEIEACLREVYRVLKSGGRAVFWDPVQYNPVIKLYRRMAAGVRTVDEHPLRISDVKLVKEIFGQTKTKFFWLSATLIFIRFYLIDRIPPSEGRYWKLIIDRRNKHRKFLKFTHRLDRLVLLLVRPLRWWCWNVAIIATKN